MSNRDSISNWPYIAWINIIDSFSAILSENDIVGEAKRKMCATFLEKLPTKCNWLVPEKNPHSVEYASIKDDCKSFNVWLFGQLFSVFHHDYLEGVHRKCLNTQIELLQYLWENDPPMYRALLRCYLNIFQEICVTHSSKESTFQPTIYDWFSFTVSNDKLNLPKPTFRVNSIAQLHELVNLMLSLLQSQTSHIFSVCPSTASLMWKCSLSLLKNYPYKTPVYQLISHLVNHDLSVAEHKYNVRIADLLLLVLDDISTLCQLGKLPHESDLSNLLVILGETPCLPLCHDAAHVHNVYYLLLQIRSPLNESVEETLLAFFDKLLQKSDFDETAINIEVNLSNINLPLLRILLQHSIENAIRKNPDLSAKTIDVCRMNKFWKFLVEKILSEIHGANPNNGKQVINLLKFVHSVTQSAVNISYQFDLNFVFFDNKVVDILRELTNLCNSRVDETSFYLLLYTTKDVLTLNESLSLDDKNQKWLLQLLYSRWVSRIPTDSVYHKFLPLINERLREFCIVSAMSTHRYQFEKWKPQFFSQIFEINSSAVIKTIPVFISTLSNADVVSFVDHLLKCDMETLTELSIHFRPLICAIAGCCKLAKRPKCDIDLYCGMCDGKAPHRTPAEHVDRVAGCTALVVRMMESSEEARLNVISAPVRLLNHVPKTEKVLSQLRACFLSENRKIREKIVEATPYIIFKDLDARVYTYEDEVFHSFRKCLRAVTLYALTYDDSSLQYVCLNAITKLGCVPLEITLLPSVTMLLTLMLSAASSFTPLAKTSIQQVAIAHNVQMEEHIYLKYAEYVFPLVARILTVNFSTYGVSVSGLPYDHNSSLFNNLTINHVLKYLLPRVAENPSLGMLIDELAAFCGVSKAQLLLNEFKHVFSHIMLFENTETVQKVINMLWEQTNNSVADLLSRCVTTVLAELFIYYEEFEKVKWVLSEIKRLAASSSKTEAPRNVTELNVESYVQFRFFGVLLKLENQLCNDMISDASRRRVLSSFKSIIKFMSSAYISSVRYKVLFTLRTITLAEKERMPALCVEIWDVFVRRVETSLLGPILSNIFVSLLPFMPSHTQSVNSIFRYLVVEQRKAVASHCIELYFVPLAQCDADVAPIIEKADQDLRSMSLQDRLEWLLTATKHEVAEIKLHALRRIRQELATNRQDISQLILASDSVNSLIFRVLDILVEGFRNVDSHLQEASGVCLGEFGAIDPSYIPNTVIKVDDAKKYNCYEIDDVEFVVSAFTLLCRGFQMAKSSKNMDMFALAIQSLLSSYKVKQDEQCKYWSQIPKHLREIILPFYSTKYELMNANEATYDNAYLVYGSSKAQTVQKWAYNWSNFLISLLPADSKQANVSLAKEVFTFCKGPMSCEIKCMLFFLPHILLNALLVSDSSNSSKIFEEMISVIRYDQHGCVEGDSSAQKTSTQLVATEELSIISNMDLEMGVICTKTMFNLLDMLYKKYRDMKFELKGRPNSQCSKLNKFLEKFSKYQLVEKAFERKEYVRSLLYLEEYLAMEDVHLDPYLVLLSKIYVHLNDVDNVKGLFAAHSMKLRQLQNVIMLHEITDQFQDAAICYQQLLKTTTDDERTLVYEKRMIQCYLAMNQPETALRFVNSLSKTTEAKSRKSFDDVECEALWNLSQFDKLKRLTSSKSAQVDDTWGVRIGQSIVHFLDGDRQSLGGELRRIRNTLTKALHMSTAAFGGYRESYEHAVKLHILNEFEKIADLVFSVVADEVVDADWQLKFSSVVQTEFEERLNKLQPTSRALRPVLNIRQTLFSIAIRLLETKRPELVPLFQEEKHKCWLKVIEIANRARNFQLAYSNIIAIDQYQLKGFFIEKAKYYWEKMEQQEALRTLQHGLQFHFSNLDEVARQPNGPTQEQKICAEAYMLWGTYNDEVANADSATNLEYFRRACTVCKHSEKVYMKFAQFLDKTLCVESAEPDYSAQTLNKYPTIVEHFGNSLRLGCEFIYQSLSRMLNVWLDFANALAEDRRNASGRRARAGAADVSARSAADVSASFPQRAQILAKMTDKVAAFLDQLPTYYFLTAFPLIMSRFTHPTIECFNLLERMVVHCALNFPHQTLWQFASLYRAERREGVNTGPHDRARKVLNNPNLAGLQSTIRKYIDLFQEFSRLCKAPRACGANPGRHPMTSMISHGSALLKDRAFDDILIPAQKFLTIVLPRQVGSNPAYNPFPERMVFIGRVERHAHVYSSMQKPVRVGLVGTDGVVYPMIFKAMDDMRIDSRAMAFNSVVNMYLKRDAEGRDRGLRIRTYTVLPLTDKCGVIEFIPRLETMRAVTHNMRRSRGYNEAKVKQLTLMDRKSDEEKRRIFTQLRRLHPPVLQDWYKLEFPNPSSWYTARTAYVRTLAVMSIVGYTLGLGDRHSDNILLDCTNGDVIHVDFNALFNKGETLPVAELVPFRLTHSMVAAMGPLGYEGGFLYTCEIVNRIMRSHKDQLISVLNTFLYDPLDFFAEQRRENLSMYRAAEKNLKNVEDRLKGVVRTIRGNSIPLSVEGQTRRLIEEATDFHNLMNMFYGWMPYA